MKVSAEYSPEEFSIQSLGAAGGIVTGSLHRLRHGESTVIVDAGLFQGKYDAVLPDGRSRNNADLGNLKKVDTILLTHAHADHVGRLPLFYVRGLKPTTITTMMTKELMEVILNDSAKIQRGSDKLYTREDVDQVMSYVKGVSFGNRLKIGNKHDRLTASFIYNGHIPGSSSVLVQKAGIVGGILFSGDVGKEINAICGGWSELPEARPGDVPIKTLWVESTSFDRHSVSFDEKYGQFTESLKEILGRGGAAVLPILSLQRNQEITEMVGYAQKRGDIPTDCEIYKDAPLAGKFEEVYVNKADLFMTRRFGNNENYYENSGMSKSRFELKNCRTITSSEDSIILANSLVGSGRKAIILTGGGMCSFGRVRNYIDGAFGKNQKNGVILTCYQADGTEGEKMVSQGRLVDYHSQDLGATVTKLDVFSGHVSGESDTFKFLERFNLSQLELVGIVHGSNENRRKMAEAIKSRGYPARVVLPEIGEAIKFSL